LEPIVTDEFTSAKYNGGVRWVAILTLLLATSLTVFAQQPDAPAVDELLRELPRDLHGMDFLRPIPAPQVFGTNIDGNFFPLYKVGGGVTAPRPLKTPDPHYSKQAKEAKLQGKVVLWVVIGPDGLPHNIRVQRSIGYGLDEEAVNAVRKWRFQPATREGKPVAAQINIEVNFRLY
jgi:TonB family protein